jgi:hypothetical protein
MKPPKKAPPTATPVTGRRMSSKQLGEISGISQQRAAQLRKAGLSDLQIQAGERPSAKHLGKVAAEKVVADSPQPISNGHAANDTLYELQRKKLQIEVQRRRLELDERRGQMVSLRSVELIAGHVAAQHREAVRRLMLLPAELRDRCDGRDGAHIERVLRGALTETLDWLRAQNCKTLGELWPSVIAAGEPAP